MCSAPHPLGTFLYLCAKRPDRKRSWNWEPPPASEAVIGFGAKLSPIYSLGGQTGTSEAGVGHLRQVVGCFEFITASFNAAVDGIFPGLRDGIEVVFIDGSKKKGENPPSLLI